MVGIDPTSRWREVKFSLEKIWQGAGIMGSRHPLEIAEEAISVPR